MPAGYAHSDRDAVKALYARLTTLAPDASAGEDGVDAWFDKEKFLPGQDWELELEIRKAARERV